MTTHYDEYTPVLVLAFYADATGNTVRVHKHLVEMDDRGHHLLGPAVPDRQADLDLIRGALGNRLTLTHPHVIASNSSHLLYWLPAGVRELHFTAKYAGANSIDRLSRLPIPHPPLLFAVRAGQLRVYALHRDARPDLDTPLYKAPYWNIFPHGIMCNGTVPVRDLNAVTCTPEQVAALFFDSKFSGASRQQLSNHPSSHEAMWQDAMRQGHFDPAWLVPEEEILTVADLLRNLGADK
jgi:PRTRC genetic system protein B